MNCNEHTLASGKRIYIYDDLFDFHTLDKLLHFVTGSYYRPVGGLSNYDGELQNYHTFCSTYTKKDIENSKFLEYLPLEIKKQHRLSMETYNSCHVNLVTPSDKFHVHVDTDNDKSKGKGDNNTILMFFPNTNWHIEYGGDTLFLDESGEKVELYSQYTTGRIIILDGSIPHLARPSTILAPHFRYSFVVTFSEFLT